MQFRDPIQARKATELDGSKVGTDLQLVAKISDPGRKQERHGPMYEEREVHVSNVDWKASEDDVKEVFLKYGTVESVRIPRKVDGGSKGFGYVVFSSKVSLRLCLMKNIADSHAGRSKCRACDARTGIPLSTTTGADIQSSRYEAQFHDYCQPCWRLAISVR